MKFFLLPLLYLALSESGFLRFIEVSRRISRSHDIQKDTLCQFEIKIPKCHKTNVQKTKEDDTIYYCPTNNNKGMSMGLKEYMQYRYSARVQKQVIA